jgi:NAD(P)-dependent dehydrogenase (short-subunit alcohol dehydrogenase family)
MERLENNHNRNRENGRETVQDMLGYQQKRVVITGAGSGMGQAAARALVDLGAEVYALDVKEVTTPVKQFIRTDLKNRDSVAAAAKQIPGEFYALFNCAGLPGPPFSNVDTTLVNFVGHRLLTETLLPKIHEGGAIAFITSTAGLGWKSNLQGINGLLATPGFDEARAWLEANPKVNNGYIFSKQCIIVYTMARADDLAKRKIRINCLSPAPTETPMMKEFHRQFGKEMIDLFRAPCGRYATPEEMAEPLIFLNSNMARFVSGHNLVVDFGYQAAVDAGQKPSLLG